jgi:hypothetical protein
VAMGSGAGLIGGIRGCDGLILADRA